MLDCGPFSISSLSSVVLTSKDLSMTVVSPSMLLDSCSSLFGFWPGMKTSGSRKTSCLLLVCWFVLCESSDPNSLTGSLVVAVSANGPSRKDLSTPAEVHTGVELRPILTRFLSPVIPTSS